jgi:hypothetical protein
VAERSLRLELRAGKGEGVAIVWDLDELAAIGGLGRRPFALAAALDPERWELARIVSGAFDDGRLLAVAAARPRGAGGHGDEAIAGALVRDGEPAPLDEALLSVEYDEAGEPRRVGLELYETPEALPLRVAGDRRAEGDDGDAILDLRAEGVAGAGRLTLLRPGRPG